MPTITWRGTVGRFVYIKVGGRKKGGRKMRETEVGRGLCDLNHFTYNHPVFVGKVCQHRLYPYCWGRHSYLENKNQEFLAFSIMFIGLLRVDKQARQLALTPMDAGTTNELISSIQRINIITSRKEPKH